jgi:hypothetical protein
LIEDSLYRLVGYGKLIKVESFVSVSFCEQDVREKNMIKKIAIVISLSLIVGTLLYGGTKDPVAVLFQVKGDVKYSKNGNDWKKIRRNKFLFSGYQIQSGDNGSGIVTNHISGKDSVLLPNTTLVVTADGLEVKSGQLTDSKESDELIAGLMKRFNRSQSYTTVRRSAVQNAYEFDIVRHMILTHDYPYLVWENLDEKFRYELSVGTDIYLIESSKDAIVRVKVIPFADSREIKIRVLNGDILVTELQPYKQRGALIHHTVRWMTDEEKKEFDASIQTVLETHPDNSFILGSFFEKEEMWTAAMDHYKRYLDENPEEIEMTPYLFRVYKKLKLQKAYDDELNLWTQAMKE